MTDMTTMHQLESLRTQIKEVRASILDALVRIDDLRLQQIPQAVAQWQLKIGCWEQALLEAELSGRRAKRRLALMQAQVNRGEDVDEDAVEAQLETELAEWKAKVEQARLAYERAMARLASHRTMATAEADELRRVYRALMKRLHPDVCCSSDKETKTLFGIAQAAYKAGDLALLKSLEVATRYLETADDLQDVTDAAELEQELELARIEEGVVRHQLEELENCEELKRLELLSNTDWVVKRTGELRDAVRDWEVVAEECRIRERELRGGSRGQ